jgi:hypothetical protein
MITRTTAVAACAACFVSAAALVIRAQSTPRPGEPTLARVWVENRAPGETIPVAIQSTAAPLRVQFDPATVLLTNAGRQTWEYRSIPLASGAEPARALAAVGAEGWEAVGVLQSGPAGTTVLLKRPR